MFDIICIITAGLFAAISCKQYKAIAVILFTEFALHNIAYQVGIVKTDLLNPILIYLVYILIHTFSLVLMRIYQAHLVITLLIFMNLFWNFVTVLRFLEFHNLVIYDIYEYGTRPIMVMELIYLAGITVYVGDYRRKRGDININHIDNVFFVRRRRSYGEVV